MSTRANGGAGGAPTREAAGDAARAALRAEMAELRFRTAVARQASAALAGPVADACARSEAACQVVQYDRARWRAWHAGLAALYRRSDRRPTQRMLRVCSYCQAVCFGPAATPGPAAGGRSDAAEGWAARRDPGAAPRRVARPDDLARDLPALPAGGGGPARVRRSRGRRGDA